MSSSTTPINPEQSKQQQQQQQPRRNLRKAKDSDGAGIDKFELPKSTVTKLAKDALPENIKFQKDTLLAIQKSSSVFINYLASTAQEKAHDKSNKTVNAQHVLAAIKEMEMGTHKEELEEMLIGELEAYKNIQAKNKASKQQQPEQADAQEDEQDAEPEPLVNDEFDAAVLSE